MRRVLAFVGAAAIGYVFLRAGWIVLEWFGVALVAVVIAALAFVRRDEWPVAAGAAAGAALSVFALTG